MVNETPISICIPTYNRVEMLFKSFEKVIDLVDEVVIVDDCSDIAIYERVKERVKENSKIKLFQNEYNFDCYKNKHEAIKHATNDWCILLDSDNEIDDSYITYLQGYEWDENTAYLPSWAMPHFDYRKYQGLTITKENVREQMHDPNFQCMLNTANYFVNKNFYMKCWDGTFNPFNCDSIYMNYLWLNNGGKLYIVPGLQYQHRVDNHGVEEGGHYNANAKKTPQGLHDSIVTMLKNMA